MTDNFNIPSSLYSAGNVLFDSTPYTRYALETQARNRARDEAFIKSFQDIAASTTPAGMAANDIPDFMKMKQDWISSVIKNRDAYENPSKDDGAAYGQAMTKYNQLLQHIQTSKDKLKSLSPLTQVLQNPDRNKLISEHTMQSYHNGALPITDPNYQPFDVSTIDFNPKPFEQKDLLAIDNNIKNLIAPSLKNKIYGTARIDKSTNSKYTPYKINLTDKDYDNIRANASLLSGTNPAFANFLDGELNNPDDYNTLNKIYQNHFPNQHISSREDMAEALILSRITPELSGEEKSTYTPDNYYAHRQYAIDNPLPTTSGTNQQEVNSSIDDLVENQKAYAKNPFNSGLPLPVDGATLKSLNAEKLLYNNGKFIPVWSDKDGNEVFGAPMTETDYKAFLGKRNVGTKYFQKKGSTQTNTTPKQEAGYTNITETNKGTIGVKNGKWYDIKTGKPIE